MSDNSTRKSIYNIFSGVIGQVVTIAFGIYIPRLVLVSLGSESNGLLNSVNQILVYLSVLEAGVGNATTQALYGPISRNDYDGINRIMSATNKYYHKTGIIYCVSIVLIGILYPLLIISDLKFKVVFWVILLTGLPNAINFYFQGKYKLLLQADGRVYVLTNLTMIVNICTSIGKIILLSNGYGVVELQFMYFIFSIIQMLVIKIYISRCYTWLNIKAQPNYKSLAQKNYVMIHQISGMVFSNTDMLILSVACGLKTVSVYSMYTLLFGMVSTLIQNINGSVIFIMGQTFNKDKSRYLKLHDTFETYNMALTFSLFAIAGAFVLPFLKIYTDGVKDISYIDNKLPLLFILTYLLDNGRTASAKVITFAGHFEKTKHHAVMEMVINIVVSIVGVYKFGIYGVLCGTIAALLFRTNIMITYAAKNILHRKPYYTYRRWFINFMLFCVVSLFCSMIPFKLGSYLLIILNAIVVSVAVILLFFVVNSIIEREAFECLASIIKKRGSRKKSNI